MKKDLCALLRGNSYPGRGILLGRSDKRKSPNEKAAPESHEGRLF